MIAFIGSVFSPYYYHARQRGQGEPTGYCAFNIALHGPGSTRWAMTERSGRVVARNQAELVIGPSALAFDGSALSLEFDEVAVPWPRRLRGRLRLLPTAMTSRDLALDAAGQHRWWPIAPSARIEVELTQPALRWHGQAYWDMNAGSGPLEDSFRHWHWSRAELPEGAGILYDVTRRDGSSQCVALRCAPTGAVEEVAAPPAQQLPPGLWRVARGTRVDPGHRARVRQTLVDAPFYARSVLATHVLGAPALAVHESLDLERFRQPWVRLLLPFRMPRRAG